MGSLEPFSLRRVPVQVNIDATPDVVFTRLREADDLRGALVVDRSGADRVRARPRTKGVVPVFVGHVRPDGDGAVLVGSIGPDALMAVWRALCVASIVGLVAVLWLVKGILAAVATAVFVAVVLPVLVLWRSGPERSRRTHHPGRAEAFAADLAAVASGDTDAPHRRVPPP